MRLSVPCSLLVLGLTLGTGVPWASASGEGPPATVHVHASSYSPGTTEVGFHGWVDWNFHGLPGSTTRSVTDAGGLDLFDSGLRSATSEGFLFRFSAAGTYVYDSSNRTAMTGTVIDPMVAFREPGGGTPTFGIEFGGGSPSFREDVEIKRPGSVRFTWWHYGTRAGWADFTPKTRGPYSFRARLRRVRTNQTSGFSPPIAVQ